MDKKPKFDRFLRRQHRQNAKTRVSDPRTPGQMAQDMEATYTNSQPNVSVNQVQPVEDDAPFRMRTDPDENIYQPSMANDPPAWVDQGSDASFDPEMTEQDAIRTINSFDSNKRYDPIEQDRIDRAYEMLEDAGFTENNMNSRGQISTMMDGSPVSAEDFMANQLPAPSEPKVDSFSPDTYGAMNNDPDAALDYDNQRYAEPVQGDVEGFSPEQAEAEADIKQLNANYPGFDPDAGIEMVDPPDVIYQHYMDNDYDYRPLDRDDGIHRRTLFSPEQAAADSEQSMQRDIRAHDAIEDEMAESYQLNNPESNLDDSPFQMRTDDALDLSPTAEYDGAASTEFNPDQHPRPPRGTSNMILSGARKLGKVLSKAIPFAGPAGLAIGGASAINDAHNAGKRFANTANPENIDRTIDDLRTKLGLGRRDR